MTEEWEYQLRIELADAVAEVARRDLGAPTLRPLAEILARHNATMKCQLEAFCDYLAEAERNGAKNHPLYAWTKATIEDPVKQAKYSKSFALYVDGQEVYPKARADALESELEPLVGEGLIARLAKYDSNPARNPQPPAHLRGQPG